MMGLEPTNGGTTIHCLNHLATLAIAGINIEWATSFREDFRKNFFGSCPRSQGGGTACQGSSRLGSRARGEAAIARVSQPLA